VSDPVLDALHDLATEVREVKTDVGEIKTDLKDVKAEVKVTNGRVTRLEMWRHGLEVLAAARSWVKPAAIGVASGVVVTVVSVLLSRL
jgi:hypothetical protein